MSDSDEANNNETGPMTPPPTTQYDSFQTPSPSNPFSSYGLVDNTPASISYSEQSGSEPSPVWSQGSQGLSPVWSQGSAGIVPGLVSRLTGVVSRLTGGVSRLSGLVSRFIVSQ